MERETDTPFSGPEIVPAPKEELHGLFAHLEAALDARGYFRPPPKKPKMVDNLRAVLTRPGFSRGEIKVLRGVVASLDYFSPKAAARLRAIRSARPKADQRGPC